MTRLEKRVNLLAVVLPFAGTLAAIVLLWNSVVSAADLAILGVMYVLTGLGVTVGFHRMLTHRSFQAPKPVEYGFAVLGSMAVQGPVMAWVADHRKHHAHADEEGDPHSPHVGHGDGVGGVLRGLVWGGLVRILLVHHVTWSVNSVCHLWGLRPYKSDDQSRDNVVFGILALGEGWHNTHHAFPTSARHGLRWWKLDVSYWFIRALALLRLAWDVRLPTKEAQMQGQRT